jgi:hypothetical protein
MGLGTTSPDAPSPSSCLFLSPLRNTAVGRIVGLNSSGFYRYSNVITVIKEAAVESRQRTGSLQFQQREEELIQNILDAIQQLQLHDQRVSVSAITRLVHLSPTALNRYPEVRLILEGIIKSDRQADTID